MNKSLAVFFFLFLTAPLFAAVSTCETRVDKHPGSSTQERVDYCLNEELDTTDGTPTTEVVLSDVYSVQYPKPKTKKSAPKQEVTKIYEQEPVSMEYLDQDRYPVFRNDILPRINEGFAHEAALDALNAGREKAPAKKKSLTKPGREMKAVPAQDPLLADTASYQPPVQPAYGYTDPAQTQQTSAYAPAAGTAAATTTAAPTAASGTAAYAPTLYNQPQQPANTVQTPVADIQQAQALQNDPLYQNNTANGTTPAGFTDGGVMGPSGFGYNETDPAFQP